MGLSKAKQYERAKGVGVAYAKQVYQHFLRREPEHLLKEVEDHAEVHAHMYFPHRVKDDVIQEVRRAAREHMQTLIKENNGE